MKCRGAFLHRGQSLRNASLCRGQSLRNASQARIATPEAFVQSGLAAAWRSGGPTRAAGAPLSVGVKACGTRPRPESRHRKLSFSRGWRLPGGPAARRGPPARLFQSGSKLAERVPGPNRDTGSFRSVGVGGCLEVRRPDAGRWRACGRGVSLPGTRHSPPVLLWFKWCGRGVPLPRTQPSPPVNAENSRKGGEQGLTAKVLPARQC